MMAHITGSGCMSSVMLGAFLGTEATIEAAAAAAVLLDCAARQPQKNKGMSGRYHDIPKCFHR